MNENDQTLSSYEAHIREYIDGTPQEVDGEFKEWIDTALADIPVGSAVLELGSAFGRDANYIESQGYEVERTDATEGFVDLLRQQGHDARPLNAITDELGGPYAMVFANAVLLHFTPEETLRVMKKVHASLTSPGTFAFTVKQGNGTEWSQDKLGAPRFFCYWQPDELTKLVNESGFEVLNLGDGISRNAKWLHVIARKP